METNVVYNADCFDVMKDMPDTCIDLVVTDPPYMIDYKTNYRKDKSHDFCNTIMNDNDFDLIVTIMPEMYRILKDNTAIYMFCHSIHIDKFKIEFEKYFNLKNIIVWVKNNWTAGDLKNAFGKQYEFILYGNKGARNIKSKRYSDIWNFKRISGNNQLHQNQKPIGLIQRCLLSSSNKNDVILDPFMGSGTTAVACIQNNRKYIGCEINKEYYDIIMKRIQKENEQLKLF